MDKQYPVRQWAHGADLVVSQLEAQGVRQVFGIPGAKIDKVCYEGNHLILPGREGIKRESAGLLASPCSGI